MVIEGEFPVSLKEAAQILGCSTKTLRNYINNEGEDRLVSYPEETQYGTSHTVYVSEARSIMEQKFSKGRNKTVGISKANSRGENTSVESLVSVLESTLAAYKEAMERNRDMAFELGNATKEVKLLTDSTLEKNALEKQVIELIKENERLKAKVEILEKAGKPWWQWK